MAPFAPTWGSHPGPQIVPEARNLANSGGFSGRPRTRRSGRTPVMPAAQPIAGIFTRRAERSRSAWKRDGSSGASIVSTTIFWILNVGNEPRRRRSSEKFFKQPSDPTPIQVGQGIHRFVTVRGITGGREIGRGFSDSHESGHPDFQVRGLLCAQAV